MALRTKKTALKGFTLVELIVVMAIFSGILFGAMQMIDPVSKVFQRTANYESTATAIDNMRNYLEGNVGPVEFLNVYSVSADGKVHYKDAGGKDASWDFSEKLAVERFMDAYHVNRVTYDKTATETKPENCVYDDITVNVIKINNNETTGKGKISKIDYVVNSKGVSTDGGVTYHATVGAPSVSTEYAVNKTYYDDYRFEFTLGYQPTDKSSKTKPAWKSAVYNDFALTIRAYPNKTSEFSDGLITEKTTQTIATIDLTNIVSNFGKFDKDKVEALDHAGNPILDAGGNPTERLNVKVKGYYTAKNPETNTVDKAMYGSISGGAPETPIFVNEGEGSDCIYMIYSYRIQ